MSETDDAARQREEIDTLKAIWDDDITQKEQKAWQVGTLLSLTRYSMLTASKGATPFNEFSIQVKHAASHLKDKFKLQLNIRCCLNCAHGSSHRI
jgi:hypothetical protein